ncbi:hypothetical protein C3408_17625 [Candidatus Pantoea alvi]|nr:hypothetical protein C3408_17625 [Pantoea alvi]
MREAHTFERLPVNTLTECNNARDRRKAIWQGQGVSWISNLLSGQVANRIVLKRDSGFPAIMTLCLQRDALCRFVHFLPMIVRIIRYLVIAEHVTNDKSGLPFLTVTTHREGKLE